MSGLWQNYEWITTKLWVDYYKKMSGILILRNCECIIIPGLSQNYESNITNHERIITNLWVGYHKTVSRILQNHEWIITKLWMVRNIFMIDAGLWIWVCRRCKPGNTQGQPCLWDQNLDVELWQASALNRWTFGDQDRRIRTKSKSEESCRADETRQGRKRAAEEEQSSWMDMTYIYLVYTCHI